MRFFQDRSMCDTPTMKSGQANIVTGGSTLDLDGMLSLPTTPLTFAGGSSSSAHHTVLVASALTFTGSSYFAAFGTNEPIKRVTLAE